MNASTEADAPEDYMIDVVGILEALHVSGLTAEITWNGPGAISLALGHSTTGSVASTSPNYEIFTVAEAALWLRNQACRHFPDSRFALKYRNRVERPGAINTPGTTGARSWGCTCPTEQPRRPSDQCVIDPRCPSHGFM